MPRPGGIPYTGLQAVLHHLGRQDYASLRQVSRSTCEDITRHIPHIHEPYISLLLSQKTSSRQVAQWFQATRCFQHVSSIHVLIEGHVPTELFEQAMELLSERTDVTELHLQAFIAFDTTKQQQKACLTTLQPIKHLLPRLKTLALKDITIIMPYTLQQLIAAAPATGWQLQCLFISTPHWCQTRRIHLTEFSSTLHNLTRAFPNLRQLHLQVPEVDSGSIVVRKEAYDGTAAAVNLAVIPTADAYEDRLGRYPCTSQQAEVAKVALTAAIANAVLQLKFLESLTICDMPDIWILSSNEENPTALTMAAEMPEEKVAFANLVLNGELSSVRAAAAVFDTLDDCGCWLLQQHINLTKLSITTAETNWKMSWWQQDVQPNPALGQTTTTTINSNVAINGSQLTGGGTRTNQAAATPNRANIQMCVDVASCDFTCAPDLQHEMIAPHGGANHNLLRSAFIRDLRMYSLRPAPFLLCNTSSCNLELLLEHTESLAGLLADMKSLKVLKVSLCKDYSAKTVHLLPVIEAAAAVNGLESLTVVASNSNVIMNNNLLAPLTAAFGGPGNKLTSLQLHARRLTAEAPATAVFASETIPAASDAKSETETGAAAAAIAEIDSASWYCALLHLHKLQELHLSQKSAHFLLDLPTTYLPASLQVLCGDQLNICSNDAATLVGSKKSGTATNQFHTETSYCPHLGVLRLRNSQLSSPSSIASQQLHHLEMVNCRWSGGWAAAAAAWPNVRELVWMYDRYMDGRYTKLVPSFPEIAAGDLCRDERKETFLELVQAKILLNKLTSNKVPADEVMPLTPYVKEICAGFKHIRCLGLRSLPWMSIGLLQHIAQELKGIKHVRFELKSCLYRTVLKAHAFPAHIARCINEVLERPQFVDYNVVYGCACRYCVADSEDYRQFLHDPNMMLEWWQQHLPGVCAGIDWPLCAEKV